MKRLFVILIGIILIGTMAGCSSSDESKKSEESVSLDKLSTADVGLNDSTGKVMVNYDMVQFDAEKILGNPIETTNISNNVSRKYMDGIGAIYRYNDSGSTLAYLTLEDNTDYSTPRGISIGSTIEEVQKAYGEPAQKSTEDKNGKWYMYMYDTKSKKVITSKEQQEKIKDQKNILFIQFDFGWEVDDSGDAVDTGVELITMGDQLMAWKME